MSDHDSQNNTEGQGGLDQETERRNRENETGEQAQTPAVPADGEGETSFVGSAGDQSSDYLTKGENQDFQPEGQGAADTNAGTSDIETGQSSNIDATLDDGADTSQ